MPTSWSTCSSSNTTIWSASVVAAVSWARNVSISASSNATRESAAGAEAAPASGIGVDDGWVGSASGATSSEAEGSIVLGSAGSHISQPGGGSGQDGSGLQPFGGVHPSGGLGHPGGGLKTV